MPEGTKSKKLPVTSPVGMQMEQITAKIKQHKADKGIHDCLTQMHGAVGNKSPIVKTAYEAGWKYAAESVSEDSSTENPATNESKDEGEDVIKVIRRGWPDPIAKARKEYDGPDSRDEYDNDNLDLDHYKEKAQLTKHSPETTI